MCNFLYEYICNKAPHPHIFSLIFTHFKWSKLGLKQNCEASLSPINQDFLESCQYVAVAIQISDTVCFEITGTDREFVPRFLEGGYRLQAEKVPTGYRLLLLQEGEVMQS